MGLVEEDFNNMNENNTEMLNYQGNPETISAFSTYEKNRKKNKNRKAEQEESNKKKKSWNPLVQFQEAGRSLGIYGLNKIVDCFRFNILAFQLWLVGWLAGWLVGWFVGWLISWTVGW